MYATLSGVHEAHRACAGADKLLSLGLEGEAAPERAVSLILSFSLLLHSSVRTSFLSRDTYRPVFLQRAQRAAVSPETELKLSESNY